jgi:hypothetical protein
MVMMMMMMMKMMMVAWFKSQPTMTSFQTATPVRATCTLQHTIKLSLQSRKQRADIDRHVLRHAPRALASLPRHLEYELLMRLACRLRRRRVTGGCRD